MNQEKLIDILTQEMIRFNQNDPKRIHHLIKVHRFAQMIGRMEQLDEHTQFLTECASLVHDIGIRPAEEKYGMCNGKLQDRRAHFMPVKCWRNWDLRIRYRTHLLFGRTSSYLHRYRRYRLSDSCRGRFPGKLL